MVTTSEGRRSSMMGDVLKGLGQAFGLVPMPKRNLPFTIAWERNEFGQWDLVIRISAWFIPKFPR